MDTSKNLHAVQHFFLAGFFSMVGVQAFAQSSQPTPPPDTVFPLGAYFNSLNIGKNASTYLPQLGLNMWYNVPTQNGGAKNLLPGQGVIGFGGNAGTNGISLNYFFPSGTNALGYFPYYFEADYDLASNENGIDAWDLNHDWNTPRWNSKVTYRPRQLVLYNAFVYVCYKQNTNVAPDDPAGLYWKKVQIPLPWNSTLSYEPQDANNPNPGGTGLDDYVTYGNVLWRAIGSTTSGTVPEDDHWSVWMNPAQWEPNSQSNDGNFKFWVGEYCWDQDKLWQCIKAVDNSQIAVPHPSDDADHWILIASAPLWDNSGATDYSPGQYVVYSIPYGSMTGPTRPWVFYCIAQTNYSSNGVFPPSSSGWQPAIWMQNPSFPTGPSYDPGTLVCYYQNSNDPNPFYKDRDPSKSMEWPIQNTIWIGAVEYQYNNGQSPSSGQGSWVQVAAKTGQNGGTNNLEWQINAGQEIPWTDDLGSHGLYLDYTFNANSPPYNGDFLGGGSTLYLDFVSRLDFGNVPNINYPGYQDSWPVYEIDATADFVEQQSTDNGSTWTTIAEQFVGSPATLTFGDYSTDPNDVNGFYDKTGTYAQNHSGDNSYTEIQNIKGFPGSRNLLSAQIPNKYSVYRLSFQLPQTGGAGPSAPKYDSIWGPLPPNTPTPGTCTVKGSTLYRTIVPSIRFTLKQIPLSAAGGSKGIFVRGVRIRTAGIDWLLRGKLNNANPNEPIGPRFGFYKDGNGKLWVQDNNPCADPCASTSANPCSSLTWPGINSGVNSIFQKIWSTPSYNAENGFVQNFGRSAWNNFLGVQTGNEGSWVSMRIYAYLNELWRQWTRSNTPLQKDLYQIFTNGNQLYYRSIYEDQANEPPPPLQNEAIALGTNLNPFGGNFRPDHSFSAGWPTSNPLNTQWQVAPNLVFAGDAIPSSIKNHVTNGQSDFLEFALGITGWNGTNYGETKESGDAGNDDYQHYTTFFQIAGDGISGTNKVCAETCYPQDNFGDASVWTSYWTYPSLFADQGYPNGISPAVEMLDTHALQDLPNNYGGLPSVSYSALQTPNTNNGFLKPTAFQNYDPTVPYSFGAKVSASNSAYQDYVCINPAPVGSSISDRNYWEPALEYDYGFNFHPPTAPEIREETWDGIAWGAKGILYNPMGDDGGQNAGAPGNYGEQAVNTGFSELSGGEGDQVTGPPPGITPKPWNEDSVYVAGDWVIYNSVQYVCTGFYVTGTSQTPGVTNQDGSTTNWLAAPYSYSETILAPGFGPGIRVTGIPGYYGTQDRIAGVKLAMADIAPIANELKNLQWVTSYNYNDYLYDTIIGGQVQRHVAHSTSQNYLWASGNGPNDGSHPTGDPEFPFTIKNSWNVQRFTYPFVKDGTNSDETLGLPLYYNIGVFSDPNDPDAVYVVIANRRTWPIVYNYNSDGSIAGIEETDATNPTHEYAYLGAIDARIVDLKLKPNWFPQGVDYYTIENLRPSTATGSKASFTDKCSVPSTYSLTLEPGEGTLLRIAPATGVEVGRTPYAGMSYNNGNREAMIYSPRPPQPCNTAGNPSPAQYRAITWEDNGSIKFRLVDPPGSGDQVLSDIVGTPTVFPTVTIYQAPSGHVADGHNPSIATKPGSNGLPDTIGIVFSIDNYSTHAAGSRSIQFWWSTDPAPMIPPQAIPYQTWYQLKDASGSPIALASPDYFPFLPGAIAATPDVTGQDASGLQCDLCVPVITALYDGFAGAYQADRDIHPFWVHIKHPVGAPNYWKIKWLSKPLPGAATTQLRMPSMASRYIPPQDIVAPIGTGIVDYERIHFVYESDYGNGKSVIFYWPIEHKLDGTETFRYGNFTPIGWAVEASQGYVIQEYPHTASCKNLHPHVAVIDEPDNLISPDNNSENGLPIITWEANDSTCWPVPKEDPGTIECGRAQTWAVLRSMTSVNVAARTVSWSEITGFEGKVDNLPQPKVRALNYWCSKVDDFTTELIYQDTFTHLQYISRFLPTTGWINSRLKESAQGGSLSMPFEPDQVEDQGSIAYRGTIPDENSEFAVKVVANPGPSDETRVPKQTIEHIIIQPTTNYSCTPKSLVGIMLGGGGGGGANICVSCGQVVSPNWLLHPISSYFEVPIPSGIESQDSNGIGDTAAGLLPQPTWPITEDSIRTEYFPASSATVIDLNRILTVDTSQTSTLLPNPGDAISYVLAVKDSASGMITAILDSATIQNQTAGPYIGVDPMDTTRLGIGYHISDTIAPTPSGSAYLTVILHQNSGSSLELLQEQQYMDTLLLPSIPADTASDSGAFKRASPTALGSPQQQNLIVTVHPNPVKGIVKVCVEDLPAQIPVTVDVVNQLGEQVAVLYNATPVAELGLCLQLDCSELPSGIYYADLQTEGQHRAVQFTVEH